MLTSISKSSRIHNFVGVSQSKLLIEIEKRTLWWANHDYLIEPWIGFWPVNLIFSSFILSCYWFAWIVNWVLPKYLESFSRTCQKWLTEMSEKLQSRYNVKSCCWLLNFRTVAGSGCRSGWVQWGWCWLLRGQHPSYFLVRRRSFFWSLQTTFHYICWS